MTMSVMGRLLETAKVLDAKADLAAPIAQAARGIQVKPPPLAGENSGFVLHCGEGSGILRPARAFAGAKLALALPARTAKKRG
jgi:hypothetical protein